MPTGEPLRQYRFSKQQRLLTSRDFKSVFDGAAFKVSHRLLLLLALPNTEATARLGVVVSKKVARRAHERNRLKRHVREQFRLQQHAFAQLDVVVLAKPGLAQLDNAGLDGLINEQWGRLHRKAAVQPSAAVSPCN